ncbi:LLM class flavin-dependent oxidoreductase [Apibacter raozihei]|uniref:LLM class flavin-dependent oxidoreductase n=1 Tax=Apibacter raozihei TaxID=2500547 RepID=UPI000FE32B3D|nr:LLM class flavin-dependent oxidoreductase [Apibacter raozihei]
MKVKKLKLSILDQVPIRKGSNPTEALKETTHLASFSDQLGYTRFWVAEHHNISSLASSAPEILIAHLANHTKQIRLGSGGIMLPNHSALKMAENFRLLESLAPGRIDMGIGRAPGTDRLTASLLNPSNTFKEQDFIEQLYHLEAFFRNDHIAGTLFEKIKATPYTELIPQLWLLSSSGESALFAAHFGMKLSFAHFINGNGGYDAVREYKKQFRPSAQLKEPEANIAIFAFCSNDIEKIERNRALMDYRFIELERKGNLSPVNYDDIKDEHYNSHEKLRIEFNRKRMVFGTQEQIKSELTELAENYDVDEIMLITYTENLEDRLTSYQLISECFDL